MFLFIDNWNVIGKDISFQLVYQRSFGIPLFYKSVVLINDVDDFWYFLLVSPSLPSSSFVFVSFLSFLPSFPSFGFCVLLPFPFLFFSFFSFPFLFFPFLLHSIPYIYKTTVITVPCHDVVFLLLFELSVVHLGPPSCINTITPQSYLTYLLLCSGQDNWCGHCRCIPVIILSRT